MPRPPFRCAALLALTLIPLPGCMPASDDGILGELADPPDLRVRQSPNDTIRVGETVTFTAVFRDSLNPKWLYNWSLNDNGAVPVGGSERSIRWVPPSPGTYRGSLFVRDAPANSRASIFFTTTVLP